MTNHINEINQRAEEVRESIVAEARRGRIFRPTDAALLALIAGLIAAVGVFDCRTQANTRTIKEMSGDVAQWGLHLEAVSKLVIKLAETDNTPRDTRYSVQWVPKEGEHGHWMIIDKVTVTPGNIENVYYDDNGKVIAPEDEP